MKQLMIIALVLTTFNLAAQEPQKKKDHRMDFTPEEMAQLRTKQMILDLDLSESQERDMYQINLEQAKFRKARKEQFSKMKESRSKDDKPNKEQVLKMKNEILDAQIAHKKQMKALLNEAQFEKWEKMHEKRKSMEGKKRMMKKQKREHRGERGRPDRHPHDAPDKD